MTDTVLVTVKLPRNPDHDPHRKVTGSCPVPLNGTCTDVTGAHHTVIFRNTTVEAAADEVARRGYHVTRVEVDREWR